MRMKWLDDIKRRAKDVPPKFFKPESNLKPGERVIGKCPDELKALWVLNAQIVEQIMREVLQHGVEEHDEGGCKLAERIAVLQDESTALRTLFWQGLRTEVNLPYGNIGIRGDFDVVTWEDEALPSPGELFDLLRKVADGLKKQ